MQLLLLPGSPSTSMELWQQCLSGDCTDLVLCCDDGFVKTHKAILVSCLPWLRDTDTDTVIMPGIEVEKLKEAIKEFYLTNESKATLWYFCALFEPTLVEQYCPTECDVLVKVDQDVNIGVDERYLEDGFMCKKENAEDITVNTILSGTEFNPLLELEHNFNLSYNGDESAKTINNAVTKIGVYKCKYCKKRFHSVSGREKHMVEVHGVTFDCDLCGCKLSTDQSARRHKRTKHPDLFNLHCDICGCGFKNKISRDEHVKKCEELGNKEKKELHKCTICGDTLSSIKGLKAHMNIHDPNYGTYECNECGNFFPSKGLLKHHRRITQHEGPDSFPCKICGKILSRPSVLKEHIKSVHDKLFDKACPHCDYRASNNPSLKKHIESSHLGITYPCEQCNMVFTHHVNLVRHNNSVHSEDRPFVCEECGTGFKRKTTLERHQLSIHSTSSFPCGECGKMFKTEAYVTSHMRAHDESSQFPCQFCSRRFVTRTKLNMHINTHTGETPYKCPHNCGRAFHSSDQLSHHKKQCQDRQNNECAPTHVSVPNQALKSLGTVKARQSNPLAEVTGAFPLALNPHVTSFTSPEPRRIWKDQFPPTYSQNS